MINRPRDANPFEFVAVASLRAAQLMRGCTPRVHVPPAQKAVVTAQHEVATAAVVASPREEA